MKVPGVETLPAHVGRVIHPDSPPSVSPVYQKYQRVGRVTGVNKDSSLTQ